MAFAVAAFAAPAAAQTGASPFPAVPAANESINARQQRYAEWLAANADINTRTASYAHASRSLAAPFSLPIEQLRDRLRAERFAELVTAIATTPQSQRDRAREISANADSLFQSEQFEAAGLLYRRALELDPGAANAALRLAVILSHQGRRAEAYEMLLRGYAFSLPDSPEEAVATVALQNRTLMIFDPPGKPALLWDCAMCPEMVAIPAGAQRGFLLGAPYAIGRFEVTFDEWGACVQAGGCRSNPRPRALSGRGSRPVAVSWADAQEYVEWLSSYTGQRYSLPTDAQWEFAARGGTTGSYYWGVDESPQMIESHNFANFGNDTTSGNEQLGVQAGIDAWTGTAPVGRFAPNAFGVFDSAGNVAEWTAGCLQPAASGEGCDVRPARGGSYSSSGHDMAVERAMGLPDASRRHDVGFRVVRALD